MGEDLRVATADGQDGKPGAKVAAAHGVGPDRPFCWREALEPRT